MTAPNSQIVLAFTSFLFHFRCLAMPDYGVGTVDKCLGPTTSKGPTKDGCKMF